MGHLQNRSTKAKSTPAAPPAVKKSVQRPRASGQPDSPPTDLISRPISTAQVESDASNESDEDDQRHEFNINCTSTPISKRKSRPEFSVSSIDSAESQNQEQSSHQQEEPNSHLDSGNGSSHGNSGDSVKPQRKQSKPQKRKSNIEREIAVLQRSTALNIPKLAFQRYAPNIFSDSFYSLFYIHLNASYRCVREVISEQSNRHITRITGQALLALQESAEMHLTILFEDAFACCLHRSRVTLSVRDMRLVYFLRRINCI